MNAYYSFLPYIRNGLNTYLTNPDIPTGASPTQRMILNLKIGLKAQSVHGSTNNSNIDKNFALKGPGDVTGINKNEIIKVSPENWVTNFEPNYLPFIEFHSEDFCWRYTPARYNMEGATGTYMFRLRPWITLVVLKEDEYETIQTTEGKTAIRIKRSADEIFPPQTSLWAHAHVHVNDNIAVGEDPIGNDNQKISEAVTKLKNTVLKRNPEKVISRLISTRRLMPNTGYMAFLIPTFETGRRAGLGMEPFDGTAVQMLQGAWNDQTPAGTEYPVYHQWYFKTGDAGDFESLVRLLKPRVLNHSVGKRLVDLQKSNNPQLDAVTPPEPTINLRGIAQPINATEDPWSLEDTNPYTKELRSIINKPTVLLNQVESADPIIAPPIYGRWHAAKDSVPAVTSEASQDWLQEANLDPRFRIFAGAGVETIRRNQEEYMNIAWEQIGEVMEANRKLQQLQLSKSVNYALYKRHFMSLSDELLVNISAPAHQRMINISKQATVFKEVDNSRIPVSAFSGAFRRLTRTNSTLMKGIQMSSGAVNTQTLLKEMNNGSIQIATPYVPPAGQLPYDVWAPHELTPGFTMSLPPNAGFQFANPGVISSEPYPGDISPPVQAMVQSIAGLHQIIEQLPHYSFPQKPALSMNTMRNIILTRTEPYTNALAIANNFIKLSNVKGQLIRLSTVNQIMAAPKIKIPMYEELAKLSPDWIMPGLGDIEMNSINILKVNQKYLEAYMLGLNYEMGRELMWRGYPTDQRGTYFSFFWGYNDSIENLIVENEEEQIYNLENYRDIEDIHKWRTIPGFVSPLKKLGTNSARAAGPSLLVLTIRGELLRKYPGTVIYLQKAEFIDNDQPRKVVPDTEVYPVFTGKVNPDIYLLGFPMDADTLRGTGFGADKDPGYYVIFQERVTEIRFGADEEGSPTTIASWDDVNWSHIKSEPDQDGFIEFGRTIKIVPETNNPDGITWNWNSATAAYALHQSPVKLNVHADGLIPKPGVIQ